MPKRNSRLAFFKQPEAKRSAGFGEIFAKLSRFYEEFEIPDWTRGERGPEKSLTKKQSLLCAVAMPELTVPTYERMVDFLTYMDDLRTSLHIEHVPARSTLHLLVTNLDYREIIVYNQVFRRFAGSEWNDSIARDGTGFTIGIGSAYMPKKKASLAPWINDKKADEKKYETRDRREFIRIVIDVNTNKKYVVHFAVASSRESEQGVARKLDENYPDGPGYRNAYADAYYSGTDDLESLARRAKRVFVVPAATAVIRPVRKPGDLIRNEIVAGIHDRALAILKRVHRGIPARFRRRPIDRRRFLFSVGVKKWKEDVKYGTRSAVENIIGCMKRLYGFWLHSRKPETRLLEAGLKVFTWNFHCLTLK